MPESSRDGWGRITRWAAGGVGARASERWFAGYGGLTRNLVENIYSQNKIGEVKRDRSGWSTPQSNQRWPSLEGQVWDWSTRRVTRDDRHQQDSQKPLIRSPLRRQKQRLHRAGPWLETTLTLSQQNKRIYTRKTLGSAPIRAHYPLRILLNGWNVDTGLSGLSGVDGWHGFQEEVHYRLLSRRLWNNCVHSITYLLLYGQTPAISANFVRRVIANLWIRRRIANRMQIFECSYQRDTKNIAGQWSLRSGGGTRLSTWRYGNSGTQRMSCHHLSLHCASQPKILPFAKRFQTRSLLRWQAKQRRIFLPFMGFWSANVCRNEFRVEWDQNLCLWTLYEVSFDSSSWLSG